MKKWDNQEVLELIKVAHEIIHSGKPFSYKSLSKSYDASSDDAVRIRLMRCGSSPSRIIKRINNFNGDLIKSLEEAVEIAKQRHFGRKAYFKEPRCNPLLLIKKDKELIAAHKKIIELENRLERITKVHKEIAEKRKELITLLEG